jgi:hypothetical protein
MNSVSAEALCGPRCRFHTKAVFLQVGDGPPRPLGPTIGLSRVFRGSPEIKRRIVWGAVH